MESKYVLLQPPSSQLCHMAAPHPSQSKDFARFTKTLLRTYFNWYLLGLSSESLVNLPMDQHLLYFKIPEFWLKYRQGDL